MMIPKKYKHLDSEQKWANYWEQQKTYAYQESSKSPVFSIDTPPPTVSGSLHIGHVFSYTHTDIIARFKRMNGFNVCYPMGWDDNGLPTERRVQNVYGITCDPKQAYDSGFIPKEVTKKEKRLDAISRKNFIETCQTLTHRDEQVFEQLWRRLGLSVDWSQTYASIDTHCRRTSQQSFLDLVAKGHMYQQVAPAMWDVDFQTAVAQAEVEDRDIPGAYHDIEFQVADDQTFIISTTRPELLPACIAVVAHPLDERYQSYFGKTATTPLFFAEVPILPSEHADPEKGSGILMVCTFGDIHDVEWWKQSQLPLKQVINDRGRMREITFGNAPFDSSDAINANKHYQHLIGLPIKKAQVKIVEMLGEATSNCSGSGPALIGDPKPITHPVKFYEKGDRPLEFRPTRQWFIKILDHKDVLIEKGREVNWYPEYMHTRYENWVEGLNQDWCISRQRFFGVPIPVWYPIDSQGQIEYKAPIFPNTDSLPIDPQSSPAPGYSESSRGKPNGFVGDPDVMDTWATSSMTPQIMSHWVSNPTRHKTVFPMDLRPQSHEIIRTWAFYTIVKAHFHDNSVPWKNVMISGWILDPDRKKMSKSKGNVVTPEDLLDEFSSDAIRYWASRARLGVDTAFDASVFTIGRKLITKLFNAAKFVAMQTEDMGEWSHKDITEPLDMSWRVSLDQTIERSSHCLETFDYAAALDSIETRFWEFCDHYLELVKGRAYREIDVAKKRSALAGLSDTISVFLKLFAPYIPYITEEIWSWTHSADDGSIHQSSWPKKSGFIHQSDDAFKIAIEIMSQIRSEKTAGKKSLNFPVQKVTLHCTNNQKQVIQSIQDDLMRAGTIERLEITVHKSADLVVELQF